MDIETIQLEAEEKMGKALEVLEHEGKGLRTGRANPTIIENVKVECYGAFCPLKEVAAITAPDPRMLVVKPYDVSVLKEIDKAIQRADLGLNPSSDGKLLRISIPPLSEERRKKMVGSLKDYTEKAKVALRNIRRDANKSADTGQKDKSIPEDDAKRCKDGIQELMKTYEAKLAEFLKKKSDEILDV